MVHVFVMGGIISGRAVSRRPAGQASQASKTSSPPRPISALLLLLIACFASPRGWAFAFLESCFFETQYRRCLMLMHLSICRLPCTFARALPHRCCATAHRGIACAAAVFPRRLLSGCLYETRGHSTQQTCGWAITSHGVRAHDTKGGTRGRRGRFKGNLHRLQLALGKKWTRHPM